jgi:hypothetical protein
LRIHALAGVAVLVLLQTACDDPNDGLFEPIIQEDTVDLAAPLVDDALPTALDVALASSGVRGRFPELVADAEQWDLAIRRDDGALVFAPAGIFGFQNPVGGPSSAAVTLPLERAMDELVEAPTQSSLRSDTTVAIRTDRIYVVRSRRTAASFAGCENYAKVQPLSVDAVEGVVKLRIIGNARCNDPRLAEEG